MIKSKLFYFHFSGLLILFILLVFQIKAQSPKFDSFKILKNKKNVEVSTIFQDDKGLIWLGTNYGLVKYDGVDYVLFTESDSLSENNVSAIQTDDENNLWIGHKSGKISIYKDNRFTSFNPEEGSTQKQISSFYKSSDQIMWFSTLGEGVYYYSGDNRKRIYNLNSDDGLLDDYVYSVVQDSSGLMYFATDKGISVYNHNEKKFVYQITMANGLLIILLSTFM